MSKREIRVHVNESLTVSYERHGHTQFYKVMSSINKITKAAPSYDYYYNLRTAETYDILYSIFPSLLCNTSDLSILCDNMYIVVEKVGGKMCVCVGGWGWDWKWQLILNCLGLGVLGVRQCLFEL